MLKSTLEQWFILQTIIEQGGFTAAAEHLYKSQSSISYAIKHLQDQLGIKLLHTEGKKVSLTPIGEALMDDIRPLLNEFDNVERKAKILSSGSPAKISIEVDSLFPKSILFNALARFIEIHPHIQIELREQVRLTHKDNDRKADLFIGSRSRPEAIDEKLFDIETIAVAHPDHPLLHRKEGDLALADLSHFTQIYIDNIDRQSSLPFERRGRYWIVNTVESAIESIKCKLCFGWLPLHRIQHELDSHQLTVLPLEIGQKRVLPMYLVFTNFEQTSPIVRVLADLIKAVCKTRNV
ncbi:LysR family transcriptional regulator [Vibrio viridaestus]|uniref:LysR family transcriptional regulator n=1 Tax=Vibrio viridaestus TaxID=2487322 RepID=A0A3N9TDX9_9VIBR|nr:LysR family transcriptional regulator [Vibrio viridaestus]RQW62034.1 LysR family transcriptional regulator [Vibrio viridaestus]